MAASEGVQYPGDVRNHGLQDYRDGDVRAHRRGWGGHGSGLLWVLRNYETRKVCSWFCKYKINVLNALHQRKEKTAFSRFLADNLVHFVERPTRR